MQGEEERKVFTKLKERKEKSMAEVKNYFQELYDVNVNDKTEKKNVFDFMVNNMNYRFNAMTLAELLSMPGMVRPIGAPI